MESNNLVHTTEKTKKDWMVLQIVIIPELVKKAFFCEKKFLSF